MTSLADLEARCGPPQGLPPADATTMHRLCRVLLEQRRRAIVQRLKPYRRNGRTPPDEDLEELYAVAKAYGLNTGDWRKDNTSAWWQHPFHRPTWRELHALYDSTSPLLEKRRLR